MTVLCSGMGGHATPNLVRNGSFVGHIGGWRKGSNGVSLAFEPGESRSSQSGSLALTFLDEWGATAYYRATANPAIPLNGASAVDIVAFAKTDQAIATMSIALDFRPDAHFDGATLGANEAPVEIDITGGDWVEVSARDIDVPDGATHVGISVTCVVPGGAVGSDPVYVSDFYVGPAGEDTASYPAAPALPLEANRFYNGGWENNQAGLFRRITGAETFTRDTVAPISGTASPKVVTVASGTEEGMFWTTVTAGAIPVDEGEPLRVQFSIKGAGIIDLFLSWISTDGTYEWTGTATASPQTITVDTTVPEGACGLREIYWWISDSVDPQAVTFWIDDVFVGTPTS